MNVEKLIQLIPEQDIDFLSVETNVNHQVKKLHGAVVFKLLLFSMLNSNKVSYRVMEEIVSSARFIHFLGDRIDVKFNSIRDRICTIEPTFFEQLFHRIFSVYNEYLGEEKSLVKVDSTYVSIASKLVSWSMQNGQKQKNQKQVKYSVSMKGSLPCGVRVFTDAKYISEDLALSESIMENDFVKGTVVVFDRGLQSRKKFDQLSAQRISFVTRISPTARIKDMGKNKLKEPIETNTLLIQKDNVGKLSAKDNKWTNENYRIITATTKEKQEPIVFLTNNFELTTEEITTLYKQRWDIELLFKFLKQHLNLTHIVSRNENAIKVVVYMTMITAVLLLAYKKLNNKSRGFKITKLAFEIELDKLMIKEIVILSGGNPDKVSYLWNST
ncbi:MAG TPA: IS4 family transposase [Lactovum miscens]|uniref:IS4 family transposase n=1 Tax=Lactovum miscens TaxID=190387 RepID=UPI002EDBA1C6